MTLDGILYTGLYLVTAGLLIRAFWPRPRVPMPPPRSGEEHAAPGFLPEPHARDAAARWMVRHGYASPRWGYRARIQRRGVAAARRGETTIELRGAELTEAQRSEIAPDLTYSAAAGWDRA